MAHAGLHFKSWPLFNIYNREINQWIWACLAKTTDGTSHPSFPSIRLPSKNELIRAYERHT